MRQNRALRGSIEIHDKLFYFNFVVSEVAYPPTGSQLVPRSVRIAENQRSYHSRHFRPITACQVILMTMPSVCEDENHCPTVFDNVELVAVVIFTLEYAARVYAAPEAYPVRRLPS